MVSKGQFFSESSSKLISCCCCFISKLQSFLKKHGEIYIAVQNFPKIVAILQHDVTIRSGTKDCCDPLTIQFPPPLSVYEHGEKALLKMVEKKGGNYCLKFASTGNFSRESLPILHNKRVSMGLTDRRKTAKNLVDSRKN